MKKRKKTRQEIQSSLYLSFFLALYFVLENGRNVFWNSKAFKIVFPLLLIKNVILLYSTFF